MALIATGCTHPHRPAARGVALVFTILCLGTLVSTVQGEPVSTEQLHGKSKQKRGGLLAFLKEWAPVSPP